MSTRITAIGCLCIAAMLCAAPIVAQEPVPIPEPSEEAMRFYNSGNLIYTLRVVWAILLPGLIAFLGFGARLRNVAQAIGRWPVFTAIVMYALVFVLLFIINLPLNYYTGYVRLHAYGLSNQELGKWFWDSSMALVFQVLIGAFVVWIPFWLMRRAPHYWWLFTGLLICPFIFVMMMILPVWVDPVFNTFGPMKDKELETKILALADRAGIEGSRVFEVDKSVDTKAVNAYVTGFLDTKRIVLWDTIIEKLDEDELLFVMAHEMGHYVLGHVVKGVFFYSGLILVSLFLLNLMAQRLLRRYSHRLGFAALGDPASLPLILMLMQVLVVIMQPIGVAYSRHIEHESDRFALELVQDNRAGAMAFVKLQDTNLANPVPGPIYKVLRASHPPLGERITFCNEYAPWRTGEPLRYGHLFDRGGE